MAHCILFSVISCYLLMRTTAAGNVLPAQFGFDVSTGLQSEPLTPSQIGDITSSSILSDAKHYKFFGWPSDHDVAAGILNASSSPQDITFYIALQAPIAGLDVSDLRSLVTEWDDLKENIYCIALVNEPAIYYVDFSILPAKLRMAYSFIQNETGWDHTVVSIPFSQTIFGATYPVPQSVFKEEHRPYLSQIIDIYKEYGAPFSINLYPFYVAPHEPTLMAYILGEEALGYSSMFVAQYMATWYSMEALSPSNGLEIVVTETGWSTFSSDYDFATLQNAQIYYDNLFRQMKDVNSEIYGVRVYAFELFNEDAKPGANWELNWGVFDERGELKWNLLNQTAAPTTAPSKAPTTEPTVATMEPTTTPSEAPSGEPTTTPSETPSETPTTEPTVATMEPTTTPSEAPSGEPTTTPSKAPSGEPTTTPSEAPSGEPTTTPSEAPSGEAATTTVEPIATDEEGSGCNRVSCFMICIIIMVFKTIAF